MDQNTMYLRDREGAGVVLTRAGFVPGIAAPSPPSIPAGLTSLLSFSVSCSLPLAERSHVQPVLQAEVVAPASLRAALRASLDHHATAFYLEVPGAGRWWMLEGLPIRVRDDDSGRQLLDIRLDLLANYLPRRATAATVHVALDVQPADVLLVRALTPLSAAHLVPRGD